MRAFKSVVAGVALTGAAAALPAVASAEGLPDRGYHSAPPPGVTWSGFYVGLNAGYAWGDADSRSKLACPDEFCAYTNPDSLAFIGGLGSGDVSGDGFTGGVQAGYNWQRGNVVFGIEADFNALDVGGTQSRSGAVPGGAEGLVANVATSISTDWLLTVRGRLGVTLSPTVLLYATGGLAIADVEVSNKFLDNAVDVGGGANNEGASSNSDVRTGWTAGGGLEWAIDRNWSIKGEYLYVDLGSVSTTAGVGALDLTPNPLDTSVDVTAHIVRVGINYRF
jgi:outer membrane immunogenic protein